MTKRSPSRRAFGAACALVVGLVSAGAHAQSIAYSAPAECPEEAVVARAVRAELARRRIELREPAAITIARQGERFAGTLRVGEGGAWRDRTLDAASCADLVDGLVLVLALGLSPAPAASEPEPPPPAPPAAEAPPAPPVDPPEARRFFVGLGAGVLAGLEPSAAPAADVAAGARVGPALLEVHGTGALANGVSLGEGGSARFQSAAIGARACWVFGPAVSIAPCLGLDALLLHGSGSDLPAPHDRTATTLAPTASVRIAASVSRNLAVALRLTGAFPLERPDFTLAERPIHRAAALAGGAVIGAELWL